MADFTVLPLITLTHPKVAMISIQKVNVQSRRTRKWVQGRGLGWTRCLPHGVIIIAVECVHGSWSAAIRCVLLLQLHVRCCFKHLPSRHAEAPQRTTHVINGRPRRSVAICAIHDPASASVSTAAAAAAVPFLTLPPRTAHVKLLIREYRLSFLLSHSASAPAPAALRSLLPSR